MKKLFIIHGWTYSTKSWDECVSNLKRLGFDPVVLNVPGLSEPSAKVFTLNDYVSWLCDKIKGEEDAVLVGHSNGGRIAIAYGSLHPKGVSGLVLVDSAGIVRNDLPIRLKRTVFGSLDRAGKKIFKSNFARKLYYKIVGESDYERAPENMRKTMAGLIAIDLKPKLSEINIPTLIIWGDKDKVTPVRDAEIMASNIKNSELVIIPEAGHSPHLSHPSVVAETIAEWLKDK